MSGGAAPQIRYDIRRPEGGSTWSTLSEGGATARDPKYDVLFEPVRVGPKTMRNRFYQSAHCMGGGSDNPGLQAHFRAMKAEGGWAAVSTEYCAIAPESDDVPRVSARLWDEGDVRNLSVMCDMLHEHETLAAVELWHGGPAGGGGEARVPRRGASETSLSFGGKLTNCKEMDKDDIREVQRYYVRAAELARRTGFDIVTLYAAHGATLIHQFLLPLFNRRSDEYGGNFENRARFGREVLELVREAVGDNCAVTCRFGVDTLDAPIGLGHLGIRAEGDGFAFIELCDDLVDMWDINVGWLEWGEDAGPSRTHPENHERERVAKVKEHTKKPVMNVGRVVSPDTMVEMIRSGQCDIIGAARPSISEPFLPITIEEGRIDDIRECIGCNICISRWEIGGPIICTQNATSGEEYRRGWHPEKFDRAENADNDVLVVGAGPAGMECAMVLGKRGMRRVHLVEAQDDVGGIMRWIPKLPGLGEWARVVNYRKIQLDKLKNVEFIPNAMLDAQGVKEYGAEIVVIATGASWATDGMNGITLQPVPGADASLPHVLTPEQVMAGKETGERVVIFDVDGYFMGVGMAEKLVREGRAVTYLTPFETVAPYTQFTLEAPRINRTLRSLGVRIVAKHVLVAIEPGMVKANDVWAVDEDEALDIKSDSVVLVTQRNANDRLFRELKSDADALVDDGIKGLYEVGDCVVPQMLADAIFSGHRLARELDSSNPATPLPFIRERRLLGATEADYQLSPELLVGRSATSPTRILQ
jgi:dimethylamine/trimethylamine dehydrogenase